MRNCEKIDFSVVGPFGKHQIKGAITANNLSLPSQTIGKEFINNLKNIPNNVKIEPYKNAQAKILIGQDNWELIVTRELIEINKTDLAASRSLLGWALHGPTNRRTNQPHTILSMKESLLESDADRLCDADTEETSLDELIRKYFEIDALGVNVSIKRKNEHEHSLKILEETSQRVEKGWETGLLWKKDYAPDVDSLPTARKRLSLLEKRLDRDSNYANLYYREMERFINLGYATKIDKNAVRPRIWYLPHFGVQNINKPNKIRLVFDAAAKTAGVSLNDQLEAGPDLLQSLPGVLMRFRQYKVALKGDIADMFLRVKVREKDRGAQRFLWRGKNREKEPDLYEMSSLIFGAKSSPCSAIFIKNKNAARFSDSNPDASKSIINDSYMDDYLTSRDSESRAAVLVKEVIRINAEAGFEMHGWASNCSSVLPRKANDKQSSKDREMRLCDRAGERVLGLFWDTQTDNLKFNVEFSKIPKEVLNGNKRPTKREILRVIMSIYDPLGLLAPFTLTSKILMQEIWRSGIHWDDKVRDEEYNAWRKWIDKLSLIKDCQIPRCISPVNVQNSKVQLHVFCDASLTAYAAAAYLRFENENGQAHVSLIITKSRVAPLKPLSVPRLELQAALLGARLAKYTESEINFKISRRYLWSDSATVMCWIRSEPRTRQVFVAHRLGEIAELTHTSEWRWVPSKQNSADDATRFSKEVLHANDRWFKGPEFLRYPESEWPKEKSLSVEEKTSIDKLEVRKSHVYTIATTAGEYPLAIRLLGWQGLLTIARRVRKYFNRWRKNPCVTTPLQNITKDENYVYRVIQAECFGPEIIALRNGRVISKNSKIISLKPFLDEDLILRANGRATSIPVESFNNRPIILESKRPATKALIAEYHRRYYHGSSNTVLNELRQNYVIIGLRNALKSLISKCIVCRLRRGKPQDPLMAALPAGRLAYRQRPFSHCGVDYFGPMLVKIGRRREKRWGVLFTCLTTRAIHLEIAHSLSASSAIMALQRLSARRGVPLVVYSDNGTNFRGASKELKDAVSEMETEKIAGFALSKRIEWRFNPPDAPHMGGAWERLIRSVKIALNAILHEQAPSEEVLITLFAEAEHSVNSRPLTHLSLDPRDDEALTPNHFLIGTSSGEIQLGRYDEQNLCLRKQWKLAQSFADAFWKRWIKEYLPTLIPRKKWTEQSKPLEIGDIVLIIDFQSPRNCWRKGKISRVFPGVDGQVRIAEVHTPMGDFMRPTRKLIKLLGTNEVQN